MRKFPIAFTLVLVGLCCAATNLSGQSVPLGTWLQEGSGSVTGSGSGFIATPVYSGIADTGNNFGERNAARHRVYQEFGEAVDFSADGQMVIVNFDVVFSGAPKSLDTDFRMSLVDTSTNQGFYGVSFDMGGRAGTYCRARFVDNLDGVTGDPHGGAFNDAINGSGTIAQAGAAPTITNGATELGLVDGNLVRFSVALTRNAGDSFSFVTNVWESGGDVFYQEVSGSYDPVNPTSGDTEVANIAINSFDGIVFGIFDDDPWVSAGSYAVSSISIKAVSDVADLGIPDDPDIEVDENGDVVLTFERCGAFLPGTVLRVERSMTLLDGSFDEIYQFDFIKGASTFVDTGIQEAVTADQFTITDTNGSGDAYYRVTTTLPD